MKAIARIVASKWFAGPLCALPFFILAQDYLEALRQIEGETAPATRSVQTESNATLDNSSADGVEYADYAFTVSEEEFQELTGGTFRSVETNDTEAQSDGEASSFTVPEDEFEAATQTLKVKEGEELDELIAGKVAEEAAQVKAGANLNERFLHETGNVAISYFLIVLCFSPLKRLFQRAALVSALNRHRRLVGLTAFFYVCLHLVLYFDDGLNRLFDEWNLFYIQCGLASFLTMMALAVTSNQWAIRKLGGRRWKSLHRLVYLAIPALLYHKGWSGKASPDQIREVFVWFAPMLLLQSARLTKFLLSKRTP